MVDLFAGMMEFEGEQQKVPQRPEWSKKDKLAFEREMLGLYVSDHPLAGLEMLLAKHSTTTITALKASDSIRDGDNVTVAGLITDVQRRTAKNSGNPYGLVQIEDFGGEITVLFLGRTYTSYGDQLRNDTVAAIRGRVSVRDDGIVLHAQDMNIPDVGVVTETGPLTLSLPEQRATTSTIGALNEVLTRHPGDTEVRMRLENHVAVRTFELPQRVNVTPDLFGELKQLLGPNCLT